MSDEQIEPISKLTEGIEPVSLAEGFRQLGEAAIRAVKALLVMFDAYRDAQNAHYQRHHAQELPARSVLHAKYDHRRRARRARSRR